MLQKQFINEFDPKTILEMNWISKFELGGVKTLIIRIGISKDPLINFIECYSANCNYIFNQFL